MSLIRVVVIDSCLCSSDGWRVQEKRVDAHASARPEQNNIRHELYIARFFEYSSTCMTNNQDFMHRDSPELAQTSVNQTKQHNS